MAPVFDFEDGAGGGVDVPAGEDEVVLPVEIVELVLDAVDVGTASSISLTVF